LRLMKEERRKGPVSPFGKGRALDQAGRLFEGKEATPRWLARAGWLKERKKNLVTTWTKKGKEGPQEPCQAPEKRGKGRSPNFVAVTTRSQKEKKGWGEEISSIPVCWVGGKRRKGVGGKKNGRVGRPTSDGPWRRGERNPSNFLPGSFRRRREKKKRKTSDSTVRS